MKLGSPHLSILMNFLLLVLSIGGVLVLLQFRSALWQESDTPNILKAALFMELTHADVAVVNSKPQRLLVKTFSSLKIYLEQQDWTWVDQMGAVVWYQNLFEKSAQSPYIQGFEWN
jgi:hypothetical protein